MYNLSSHGEGPCTPRARRIKHGSINDRPAPSFDVTMTELCKLAGVSTRTLYQLFVSKQAYFLALAPVIGGEGAVQVILACEEEP
jgi:hypothetical protein